MPKTHPIIAVILNAISESLKNPLIKSAVPVTIPMAVVKHAKATKTLKNKLPVVPNVKVLSEDNISTRVLPSLKSDLNMAPLYINPE